MTQSRVGVSLVSSLIDARPDSSVLESSLARLPPPRRFRVTPLLRSREGEASLFSNGPSSISEVDAMDGLLVGRGRSDGGIGRL